MNDYTRYTSTIKTDTWTRIPVREEWMHPNHIFGIHKPILKEIHNWLDNYKGDCYAIIEEEFTDVAIAFSNERDAAFFLLRWS